MTVWANGRQLAGLPDFPSSERRASAAARRMGITSRKRSGRGGGIEFLVESLPPAARLAWASKMAAANDVDGAAATVPSAHQARTAGTRSAALVLGWRKDRRDAVARVLIVFQRFWQTFGGQVTPALHAFCHAWNEAALEVDAALRASFPRMSFSTLRAWHVGLEQKGLTAITPREHARKGQYQALAGEVGTAMLAILFNQPHLSAQAIYEALQTQFEDLPSDRAFRRALAYWKRENAQAFEAAVNPDGWRNKYKSAAGSFSENLTRPNQKWEVDSTVGDLMLADGKRHNIIAVIDVFTRRRLFLVARTSTANGIMSLLRRAIGLWGVPETLKSDNGQDYVSQVLETALLGLGIEHLLCQPFTPMEKPHVERAIGSLMDQLFELLPGFIGHSVADAQAIRSRKGFAERFLKEAATVELRLTPEQLQAQINTYCERMDHKPRSYLAGRTPLQMAQGFQAKVVNERALDILLAPSADSGLRVIGKKGIKIGGGFYNHAHLGGAEGTQVQVRVDDSNLGRCWVFDMDGQFICEALDYQRLGIKSTEVAAERKAHQARVIKAQKAEFKLAKKDFDATAAVASINRARTEEAIEAAPNVVSIQRAPSALPALEHTSVAIASIEAAALPVIDQQMVDAAQAALVERLAAPKVRAIAETPQMRFARWLKLQERVARSEAMAADEANWFEGYAQGAEWASMQRYFETFGLTADQVLTG